MIPCHLPSPLKYNFRGGPAPAPTTTVWAGTLPPMPIEFQDWSSLSTNLKDVQKPLCSKQCFLVCFGLPEKLASKKQTCDVLLSDNRSNWTSPPRS